MEYTEYLEKRIKDLESRPLSAVTKGDNIVEFYRNKAIVENLPGCFEVVDDVRFIVGLDDSKTTGKRESAPATVEDAKRYIDWKLNHKEV